MRNLAFVLVLLSSMVAFSQSPPNRAYPITVHVISSRIVTEWQVSEVSNPVERIKVLINGKKYTLQGKAPKVTTT